MANEKKVRNGPRTNERGCTQASVSDKIIDDDVSIIPSTPAFSCTAKFSVSINNCDDVACNGVPLGCGFDANAAREPVTMGDGDDIA